jgi:hypothetical protein
MHSSKRRQMLFQAGLKIAANDLFASVEKDKNMVQSDSGRVLWLILVNARTSGTCGRRRPLLLDPKQGGSYCV